MRKRNTFRPTDIGGCQLWLDGADTTTLTGSTTITAWRDKSANNLTVTATGSPTRTTVNGLNSLSFDGSSSFSLNPFTKTAGATYVSWFAVANITNAASALYGSIVGTVYADFYAQNVMYINSGLVMVFYRVVRGNSPLNTTIPLNSGNVLLSTATDLTAGTYQVFQNGVGGTLQTNGLTGTIDSAAVSLQIGNDGYSGTAYVQGTISEILLYTTALTSTQRQSIEAYLAQKWGLRQQIPQNHPGTTAIVYSQQSIPFAISLPYPVIFTPLQIQSGTCQLWLDGSDPAGTGIAPANGTVLTSWIDKSGKSKNATGINSPTVVTSAVNSLSVVSYNGSSYSYSSIAAGSFSSGMVIFIVYKVNGSVTYCAPITRSIGNMGYPIDQYNGVRYMGSSGGIAGGGSSWSHASATSTTLFTQIILTSGNVLSEYVNGTSATVTGSFPYSDAASFVYIGTRDDKVTSFNGYMCEAIVYNAVFTTPQRQQVEGYLAWKWGLQGSLDASNPYKNSAPGVPNALGISRPVGLPIPSIALYPTPKGVV